MRNQVCLSFAASIPITTVTNTTNGELVALRSTEHLAFVALFLINCLVVFN